jgi:hypothetical protein
VSCYEQFGWTPDECKHILQRYPQESDLLATYFEELAAFRGEEYARITKPHTTEDPGWHTDLVLEDEEDE